MLTKALPDFIVIDDDMINNMICNKIIQLTFPGVSVKTFSDPVAGLSYLRANYAEGLNNHVILFLDINMPAVSGWDVLDKIRDFSAGFFDKTQIFLISPLINDVENEKALNNKMIKGYVPKPLSRHKLQAIINEYYKS
jgi:two-component SAPR family response regulator